MPPNGVLVVDDMKDARLVVSHIVNSQGYPLFEAATGQEALDVVGKNASIDMVFVDLSLPDMSGLDLLRRLAPLKSQRRLRLCVLTGLRCEEAREEALEAGADLFLAKPLHPHILLRRMFALGT